MPRSAPCSEFAVLMLLILQVSGCSGPREDVRVTLCKRLTETLLHSPSEIRWNEVSNEFREPEFAVTHLRFETSPDQGEKAEMQASCHFDYDAVEQNAMTHSDPFSAYASQPYQMTLNGENVARPVLFEAMNTVLRRQGKKLMESIGRVITKGSERD